jgi:hypothetical protein
MIKWCKRQPGTRIPIGIYRMMIGAIDILGGLTCLLTLGHYLPCWSIQFCLWNFGSNSEDDLSDDDEDIYFDD